MTKNIREINEEIIDLAEVLRVTEITNTLRINAIIDRLQALLIISKKIRGYE